MGRESSPQAGVPCGPALPRGRVRNDVRCVTNGSRRGFIGRASRGAKPGHARVQRRVRDRDAIAVEAEVARGTVGVVQAPPLRTRGSGVRLGALLGRLADDRHRWEVGDTHRRWGSIGHPAGVRSGGRGRGPGAGRITRPGWGRPGTRTLWRWALGGRRTRHEDHSGRDVERQRPRLRGHVG